MGCVLKHFPGYGNNADTHTGIAVDERSYDTFLQQDFLPFQAGVDAGAGCVLVSHNIVTCKDGGHAGLPVSPPGTRCSGRSWLYRLRHYRRPGDGRHPGLLRRLQRPRSRPCWRATTCCAAPTTRPRFPRCWPPWRTAPSREERVEESALRGAPVERGAGPAVRQSKRRRWGASFFLPGEPPPGGAPVERGAGLAVRESKGRRWGASFLFFRNPLAGGVVLGKAKKTSLCQGPANPTERQREVFRKATCRLYSISGEMVTILSGLRRSWGRLLPHSRPRGFAIKMSGLP